MLLADQDIAFVKAGFQEFKGWCLDDAAYLTCCLLARQEETGHAGALFEIGVYEGKYLSLLYHAARRTGLPVSGADIFQWSSPSSVMDTFQRVFGGTKNLRLITADSTKLGVKESAACSEGRVPHSSAWTATTQLKPSLRTCLSLNRRSRRAAWWPSTIS